MSTTRIADNPGPRKGRRLPLSALAALLLLAMAGLLLLAACGGDDGESTASPSGTQAAVATQTPSGTAAAEETETPAGEETQAPEATPEPSAGEIDPCALVTKEEAEAVVGESLPEPVITKTQMLDSCLYSTTDLKSIHVSVFTYDSAEDLESAFQVSNDINHYPEIEGIGDRAFDSRPTGDVTVLKGKYEVSVDVSVEDTDADFETAKEVAAKAVDRLP